MTAKQTDVISSSSAEGGLTSSIEQFDGPPQPDCPNLRVPMLLGLNDTLARAIFFRPRCKVWACPVCGPINAWLWAHRANVGAHAFYDAGKPLSFVTITSNNKITKEQSWWVAPRAWMKLQARMRREFGPFAYYMVPETQERGHVHFHGIFTIPAEKRWLKDNAAQCGFGYQDDAKEVHLSGGVTGYITKYLVKSLDGFGVPKNTRRVRTSRDWPKLQNKDPPQDWRFVQIRDRAQISDVYRGLVAQGYEVRNAGSRTAWTYVEMD